MPPPGAGALLATQGTRAQGTPGAIDVHQHYQEAFAGESARWSVSQVLELRIKMSIATVIISGGSYGDQVYTGTEAGRTMARKLNDYAAKIVSDHPKRFGFFAVVPFPDADGSLKELEYAYDTLKADGVGILSSIGDKWPGARAISSRFHGDEPAQVRRVPSSLCSEVLPRSDSLGRGFGGDAISIPRAR